MGNDQPQSAKFDADTELVEEITLGLPPETPSPAGLNEVMNVSRYLLQNLRSLERRLMDHERIDSLLADAVAGARRVMGCKDVELWLHDPVGELGHSISDWSSLLGMLKLTPDSYEIGSLYGEPVSAHWLPSEMAKDLGLFELLDEFEDVFVIPLVESGVVVGSLHLQAPRLDLLHTAANLELIHEFAESLPVLLRKVSAIQTASELMLLDPVTHVANRNGLQRDLERELGRARRSQRSVALMALNICGLEHMANLSQRHLQAQVLRQIASRINAGLRATDFMGRLGGNRFGVLLAEAPRSMLADIAWRYENDLRGQTIDDGHGGIVEIEPCATWVVFEPEDFPGKDAAELAAIMVEASIGAGDCKHHGEVELAGRAAEGQTSA